MIGDDDSARPASGTAAAYESLRSQLLCSSTLTGEWGLSVLLRSGMLAWAQARARPSVPMRAGSMGGAAADRQTPSSASSPAHRSLIDAMVAMVSDVSRSRQKGVASV